MLSESQKNQSRFQRNSVCYFCPKLSLKSKFCIYCKLTIGLVLKYHVLKNFVGTKKLCKFFCFKWRRANVHTFWEQQKNLAGRPLEERLP